MDDVTGESSQPEANFDNGFEKLEDPLAPESINAAAFDDQAEVTSSSHSQPDMPEEDLYSANEPASKSSEAEPLVDIGESPPDAPLIPDLTTSQPVSSTESDKPQPTTPEPADITKFIITLKPDEWKKSVDPRAADGAAPCHRPVLDLIYWRDVKKTGVVFGSLLVVLLSLALFSVLSVVAYLSLAALVVTITFRIYKNIMGAVQKTGEGHPFKEYLEVDISLPEDKVHQIADCVMSRGSSALRELRRLFLVEDMIDSLKFGLLLWVLTYVGAWFNGMTLVILAVVTVFTIPKVYETHQAQIDQYIEIARTQVKNIIKQIQEKVPFPGKKKTA